MTRVSSVPRPARLLLGLAALAASIGAQTSLPLRVDCGDLNGYPSGELGWVLLTETSAPPGVSLAPPALDTSHTATYSDVFDEVVWPADVMSIDPEDLDETHRLTSLMLADDTVLTVSGLPADARVRVRLDLGALFPWADWNPATFQWDVLPNASREVRIETRRPDGTGWDTVARGIRCTTGHQGNSFASLVSGLVSTWVTARADASGAVALRLSTDGTDPVFVAGFEVHEHEPLPIRYQRTAGAPLVGSTPGVGAFVAAFNAGDYEGAQLAAQAMADPFERGVALTHLAGWLDGSRHGLVDLVPDARAALTEAQPDHPAAAWLASELDRFERALDHLAARGYAAWRACPQDGGRGFLNPACEGQSAVNLGQADSNVNAHIAIRELAGLVAPKDGVTVLDDLAAWNAGAIDELVWEPSPLVFAAAKQSMAAIFRINPLMKVGNDPEAQEFRAHLVDLARDFVQLGFVAADFPREYELLLFEEIADQGLHPTQWTEEDVAALFTDEQIADSWWGEAVATGPPDGGVPAWVGLQRDFQRLYANAIGDWIDERLLEGEFGGGYGDDVELYLQLFPLAAARVLQADRPWLDALDGSIRYGLVESGFVEDGYYNGGMTDVEHSAEYTANPFLVTRGVWGHVPRTLRIGLGVAEHLRNADDPGAAWTGITALGRRHFKSYYFTANAISDDETFDQEIQLNGRAVVPSLAAWDHARLAPSHPLQQDLLEWARGWRDDALESPAAANGKPKGFMGPVRWPTNAFGVGGVWYSVNGQASEVQLFDPGHLSYDVELLRVAYRKSTEADRYTYLLPIVRMLRAVQQWEDAGQPFGVAGSQDWAAKELKDSPRFGALVYAVTRDVLGDPDLAALPDPELGNATTYVDEVLEERMHAWIVDEFNNQGVGLKYALGPLGEACGGGEPVKNADELLPPYERALAFYRAAWPVLTSQAYHTDRVFLTHGKGVRHLVSGFTGALLTEGFGLAPRVRWDLGLGGPSELAVHCNGVDAEGTFYSAFAYHPDAGPRPVRLLLDEGLVPGRYLVEWGAASPDCDLFPNGAPDASVLVQKRGTGTAATVSLQPGLNLVRITRQGDADATPPAWDLAVDPVVVEIRDGASLDLVVRATVGNAGAASAPPTSVDLFASAVLPDGTVLEVAGVGQEVQIASLPVAASPGTSGWSLSQLDVEWSVPFTPAVGLLLGSGLGVQVRAVVAGSTQEADRLDNEAVRAWFGDQIEIVDG